MRYTLRPWRKRNAALYVGGTALVTALVVLALSCCALAASGIMLQINDAPLKQVVMMLMQQSGTNIVIADESKLEKKITANLNDVPLEKALDYVVRGAGVSYKKMDDGTFIIGGSMAEATPVVLPNVIPDALPAVETAPPPKDKIVTTIKLTYSKPSELLRLMGWDGQNPQANCEAIYPDRTKGKQVNITPGGGGMNVQTSHNGDMTAVGEQTRPNTQPAIPTIDPVALNGGAGRTAAPNEGAGQVTGPSPQPYRGNQGNTTNRGNTNTTNSGQNLLWPDGIDQAVPFDLDNSIIVKGDEAGIQDFKNIIRMLDVPPKQVSIKAEFVEVKTTDVKRFGIDWSLDKLNESFSAPISGGTGNIVVGFATGNLTATLRAQLTSDIGQIINSPIISTINNQNAYISINSQIPYWTTYNTVTGTGTVIQQSQPNFINIDTHLDVLPRVNGDGTITMTLRPGVADTGNIVTGPDGTEIPEQRNQELFTQRRVANGETIVVGGFIRKNDSSSVIKIPVLGDLPIVGSLFRGVAKTTEDRELLIFITPTIIPDSNTGTVGVGGNLVP